MGKYIGENIQYGSFERQKIDLAYDPVLERIVNTYTLNQRVSNESSIFVVCDKILLQPVKDYVLVKEGFTQKIRFLINLDAIENADYTDNVEIYIVYLGKELLNSSVASVANIQDVTINNETLAAGQVLAYTSEGWKNRDVGEILTSQDRDYPSLVSDIDFLKKSSALRTWVQTELINLKTDILASPPDVLDTLNELAAALGNDQSFATTVARQIGAVDADVSALDVRVVALETDTQSIKSDISTLTDRVSTNETDIDNLESEIELKVDSSNLASSAYSGSYTDLIDTPTLATVATTGSYNDLLDTPVLFSGSYSDLTDKPTLFSRAYSDLTGKPSLATVATSGSYNDLSNTPSLATVATSGSYNDLTGKPSLATVATTGSYTNLSDKPIAVVPGLSATQGQFLAYNGTDFVSTNTLQVSSASSVPLILKGATSQTANLLEIKDSTNTTLTSIQADGTISGKRYVENVANSFSSTLTPSSGTLTIDTLQGTCVLGALSASVTTWAFTNVPIDNGKSVSVSVIITGNISYLYGDACTVNGTSVAGGVKWSGGGTNPISTSGTDIISFIIVRDSSGTIKVFGSASTNFV